MTDFVLPRQKIMATHKGPKNIIIMSKPKTGKTEFAAQLPNSLLLDLEDGSDYVDAMKVKAHSVEDIQKIGNLILKDGKPYDYIIVDTLTTLEQMCIPYAEILYSRTPMGKNWFKTDKETGKLDKLAGKTIYGSIINMPNGGGYQYLREAVVKMIEFIKTWAPRIVLLGHVKDTVLEKDGTDVNVLELDLTGKIKRILTADSDAIGYLYRANSTQNMISFKTKDDVICGARPEHLRNAEIVISEMIDDKLVTYWDKIYTD